MRQTYPIIFVLLWLVTACTPQAIPNGAKPTQIIIGNETAVSTTPTPASPTVVSTASPTAIPATAVPTATAVSPTATAQPDPAALAETLKQIMAVTLQTETGSDAPFAGFEGLTAVPLPLAQEPPLWLVHSVGLRPFDPQQNHFVAVFAYENENFREIGRTSLENPDILFDNSVQSWVIDGRLWLEVNSGVGAHGNCLDVLRFDQSGLFDDIAHCHSTMAGSLTDLNQDGLPEIVLNNTNDYVFCYACAVQLPDYAVMTWNGTEWQPVSLVKLGGSTDVVMQNNEAVALAEAGLWQEAGELINGIESQDPAIRWNRNLINLWGEAHQTLVARDAYPFLQHVFYGDYAHALALMRVHPTAELFADAASNPMIVGTPAEGMPDLLAEWIVTAADNALRVKPELADAYFLRGWATYLSTQDVSAALADIERAANLAPDDAFFAQAVSFLANVP